MRNFVAIVFDRHGAARSALAELWRLDARGELTAFGASIVGRTAGGEIEIERGDAAPPLATAAGIAVGAMLGLLAGPAGAAIGAAGGAAVGAGAGAVVGLGVDVVNDATEQRAINESGLVLRPLQHAVVADVEERTPLTLDRAMHALGGAVYRRPKSRIRADKYDDLNLALVPYKYDPVAAEDDQS